MCAPGQPNRNLNSSEVPALGKWFVRTQNERMRRRQAECPLRWPLPSLGGLAPRVCSSDAGFPAGQRANGGALASEVPQPQEAQLRARIKTPTESACQLKRDGTATLQGGVAGAVAANPSNPEARPSLQPSSCPAFAPLINWYARFLNGPQVKALSRSKKRTWLATQSHRPLQPDHHRGRRRLSVGPNSHSAYGPGFTRIRALHRRQLYAGYDRRVLRHLSYPLLAHQDPHYHRMPHASIKRRVIHCITQMDWTEGDNGEA